MKKTAGAQKYVGVAVSGVLEGTTWWIWCLDSRPSFLQDFSLRLFDVSLPYMCGDGHKGMVARWLNSLLRGYQSTIKISSRSVGMTSWPTTPLVLRKNAIQCATGRHTHAHYGCDCTAPHCAPERHWSQLHHNRHMDHNSHQNPRFQAFKRLGNQKFIRSYDFVCTMPARRALRCT